MRVCVYHGMLKKCDFYFRSRHLSTFPCRFCPYRLGGGIPGRFTCIRKPNPESAGTVLTRAGWR